MTPRLYWAFLLLVLLPLSLSSAASAEECQPTLPSTKSSDFINTNEFGSVAFAFDSLGAIVQVVESGTCYIIPASRRKNSVYFFFNHRSNAPKNFTSFLAIQIVKQYKTLRFVEERVSGSRTGLWVKPLPEGETPLSPVVLQKPFEDLAPSEFRNLHLQDPFDESALLRSWGSYFHGLPEGGELRSDQRLSYWQDTLPDNENVKVENYLMRYTVLSVDRDPQVDRAGIPFNSSFHTDMAAMALRIRSPAMGGVYLDFELR